MSALVARASRLARASSVAASTTGRSTAPSPSLVARVLRELGQSFLAAARIGSPREAEIPRREEVGREVSEPAATQHGRTGVTAGVADQLEEQGHRVLMPIGDDARASGADVLEERTAPLRADAAVHEKAPGPPEGAYEGKEDQLAVGEPMSESANDRIPGQKPSLPLATACHAPNPTASPLPPIRPTTTVDFRD